MILMKTLKLWLQGALCLTLSTSCKSIYSNCGGPCGAEEAGHSGAECNSNGGPTELVFVDLDLSDDCRWRWVRCFLSVDQSVCKKHVRELGRNFSLYSVFTLWLCDWTSLDFFRRLVKAFTAPSWQGGVYLFIYYPWLELNQRILLRGNENKDLQ